MARFSVTEAATAGFGVVARNPLAVAGWALALIVAVMLPAALCFVALGPQFVRVIELAMAQQGDTPSPEMFQQMMQAQVGMSAMNLFFWLWGSLLKAVFAAAVFRAVLTPGQSAWAFLRVGSREMWLALLLLVEQVLAMIAVFVIVLLIVVITAVVVVAAGGAERGYMAGILTAVVASFAAMAVILWVALRLSMAAPMTFVDNQFRLFESWTLTKGQSWRLLGVALLIVVFALGLEILVGAVVVGIAIAAGGSLATLQGAGSVEAFLARPPMEIVGLVWPWIAAFCVIGAVFAAIVQAVFYAPWAAVHRALTSEA